MTTQEQRSFKPQNLKNGVERYERRGDDLILVFKDGETVVVSGYFIDVDDDELAVEHDGGDVAADDAAALNAGSASAGVVQPIPMAAVESMADGLAGASLDGTVGLPGTLILLAAGAASGLGAAVAAGVFDSHDGGFDDQPALTHPITHPASSHIGPAATTGVFVNNDKPSPPIQSGDRIPADYASLTVTGFGASPGATVYVFDSETATSVYHGTTEDHKDKFYSGDGDTTEISPIATTEAYADGTWSVSVGAGKIPGTPEGQLHHLVALQRVGGAFSNSSQPFDLISDSGVELTDIRIKTDTFLLDQSVAFLAFVARAFHRVLIPLESQTRPEKIVYTADTTPTVVGHDGQAGDQITVSIYRLKRSLFTLRLKIGGSHFHTGDDGKIYQGHPGTYDLKEISPSILKNVTVGADGTWSCTTPELAYGAYCCIIEGTDSLGHHSKIHRVDIVVTYFLSELEALTMGKALYEPYHELGMLDNRDLLFPQHHDSSHMHVL